MARRHAEDGAINLNVEDEDLLNDNYELYENKDINLKPQKVTDKIAKEKTEYYIESIRHDEFIKVKLTKSTKFSKLQEMIK